MTVRWAGGGAGAGGDGAGAGGGGGAGGAGGGGGSGPGEPGAYVTPGAEGFTELAREAMFCGVTTMMGAPPWVPGEPAEAACAGVEDPRERAAASTTNSRPPPTAR